MARTQPPPDSAPTERFTARAGAYRRFRPGYPPSVFDAIQVAAPQMPGVVVDLGAGTGISALPWLQRGCTVYGIEPNAAMRAAGDEALGEWRSYTSIAGTAEDTGLPGGVAHVITAAQSLHWFRLSETRAELARIAAPGCVFAVYWNTRDATASPFMAAYDALVRRHSEDFGKVYHGNVDRDTIHALFGDKVQEIRIPWTEALDFETLEGRTRSSSYLPSEGAALEHLLEDLRTTFETHAESGAVKFQYDTELWLGRAPRRTATQQRA